MSVEREHARGPHLRAKSNCGLCPLNPCRWMVGRFVMDRNGVVWHKQANRGSKRHVRSAGTLGRLARWKALHPAYAAKLRKLPGVRQTLKYWQAPDARSVPGFEGAAPHVPPPRWRAEPDKARDPALKPH